jgi:hypothetical protein
VSNDPLPYIYIYIYDFDMFGVFKCIHFALVTDSNLRFEFIACDFGN